MSVLLDNFDPDCSKNLIAWLIDENFYHDAMSDVSIRFNVLLSTNDQICFETHSESLKVRKCDFRFNKLTI